MTNRFLKAAFLALFLSFGCSAYAQQTGNGGNGGTGQGTGGGGGAAGVKSLTCVSGCTVNAATGAVSITITSSGGSVTNFTSGNLSPIFTTSVATGSTTPAQTFSLSTAAADTVFGNCTGSTAAPSYCALVAGQIPTGIPIGNVGSAGLSGTSPITISSAGVIACSTCVTTAGANTALSNLAAVSINASLIPQTTVSLGAVATPWQYVFLYGGGTFGTDSFEITGTSTANRTVTLPDNTGTLAELNLAQSFTATQTFTGHIVASGLQTTGTIAGTLCQDSSGNIIYDAGNNCESGGGGGTVTSIATTSPITGGTITGSGTIACATCVTSASALTQYGVVIGGGLQASSTISADTTTTHALFATATAPAFRAIAITDLPTITIAGGGTNATSAPSAGAVPNTSSSSASAWTVTPSLGLSGTAGTLSLYPASGNFTSTLGSAATASNTVDFFASAPTTGDLIKCVTSSTTCTLTDTAILASQVVTSAASLTSTYIMTGAGSQASQTPSSAATLNSSGQMAVAQLLASGIVDGEAPVTITTGASATLGGTYNSGYTYNQEATAGTAVTYTLPTAAAGKQYCVGNSYNGSAADTGTLELLTSASGQYIIFTDGTLSATGGYVISGGAARDSACVVGTDATHWTLYVYSGTWTKH